jgi:hypothetical protein
MGTQAKKRPILVATIIPLMLLISPATAATLTGKADIHATRFNVWYRALFGHQRIARLCRRLTLSPALPS